MSRRMLLIAVVLFCLPVAMGARKSSLPQVENCTGGSVLEEGDRQIDQAKAPKSLQDIESAEKQFKARFNEFVAGKTTIDFVMESQTKWRDAKVAAAGSKEEKIEVLKDSMKWSLDLWKISKAKYEAGAIPISGFAQTRAIYEETRAMIVELSK